jgi:hypothetical protein
MKDMGRQIVVSVAFDNIRSQDIRFLQEAARFGSLSVWLWNDAVCRVRPGAEPKFPLPERLYYLQALGYVSSVHLIEEPGDADALPPVPHVRPHLWAVRDSEDTPGKRTFCHEHGLEYHVYRNLIPMNNAHFAGHAEIVNPKEIREGSNPLYGEGWYSVWLPKYNESHGRAAQAALQEIIDLYFPEGRPKG